MDLLLGILISIGVIAFVLLVVWAKNKGILKDNSVDDLNQAKVILNLVAVLVERFSSVNDDTIEMVDEVLQSVIDLAIHTFENDGFVDELYLYDYTVDLFEDVNIKLSEKDLGLIESIIALIVGYIKE